MYDGDYQHVRDDERNDDTPSRNRRVANRSRKISNGPRNGRDDNASIESSQPTIFDGFEECENELGRDIPESGSVHNRVGKDKRDVGEKVLRSKHTAACKYLRN